MQYLILGTWDLTDKVYSQIDSSGMSWKIKQDGATSLRTGARKDTPEGGYIKFDVCFADEDEASDFVAYCHENGPSNPDFDEDEGVNIPLYIRTGDWYYPVWGINITPEPLNKSPLDYTQYLYKVTCYLYSPYSLADVPFEWVATNQALSETFLASNRLGHVATCFESLEVTCITRVTSLALSFGSTALTLCDQTLTGEVWELLGNQNRLLETYEDTITSVTKWNADTTGDGAYSGGSIILNDDQEAYYVLAGPNRSAYPVKMTATLSLDSGGADGLAYVEISADGTTWETALDQDDFVTGSHEYTLPESDHLEDIYVRFSCRSGTSGKYLRIGAVKFEVERWVDSVPTVGAATVATATLSGTGTVTIDGKFHPRRLFV